MLFQPTKLEQYLQYLIYQMNCGEISCTSGLTPKTRKYLKVKYHQTKVPGAILHTAMLWLIWKLCKEPVEMVSHLQEEIETFRKKQVTGGDGQPSARRDRSI